MKQLFTPISICLGCAFVVITCIGCTVNHGTPDTNVKRFDISDFRTIRMSSLEKTLVTDSPDITGKGREIRVLNDSIIAILQRETSPYLSLFNTYSRKAYTVVEMGDALEEILYITNIARDEDGKIWIFGGADRKVMYAEWDSAQESSISVTPVFKAERDLMRGVPDGTGGIIAMCVDNINRTVRISADGTVQDSTCYFPLVSLPESVQPTNLMFQGHLGYSPTQNKMIIANAMCDEISIEDLTYRSVTRLKGPVDTGVEVVGRDTPAGTMYLTSPLWFTFEGIATGQDRFAVGYVGVKVTEESDFDRRIGAILEFGWDGSPINRYLFDHDIIYFDVDYKNGIIYTIENIPEPSVIKYNINKNV